MTLTKREVQTILEQLEYKSPCIRRKVGVFLINGEGQIEKTCNGNLENPCKNNICLREKIRIKSGIVHSLCFGIHAEIRLILNCIEKGISIKDAIIYCTYSPCIDCATILAMYKIKAFYFLNDYPDNRYIPIFNEAGIKYGLL